MDAFVSCEERDEESNGSDEMNKAEFVKKWEHMFKLIEDRDLFPEYSSEDLPVLMLRDALQVIMERKEVME